MLLGRFRVSGHSMEPLFPQGSQVLVSSIPYFFSSPQIHDVLVLKKNGKMMLKRIKKRENNKYFVEGDNKKDSFDVGWIERKDIIGKVIRVFGST